MNIVKQKFGGKTYVYIRESYWDPVRKCYSSRNIKSYGDLDVLLRANPNFLEELRAELDRMRSNRSAEKERRVARRATEIKMTVADGMQGSSDNPYTSLGPYVLKRIWDKLSLTRKLRDMQHQYSQASFNLPLSCFFMTAARCLMPDSKLAQWQSRNQILSRASGLSLSNLYRSLDFLCEHKDRLIRYINRQIEREYQRSVSVALYDVTTYYFESQDADTLRNFGFSKDNKVNQVQVVLGLLIDQQGVPIDYELFAGNQNEFGTMIPLLKKLRQTYNIQRLIVTADRGLNSASNLLELKKLGMDYVIAYRLRNSGESIKSLIRDEQGWTMRSRQGALGDIRKYKVTTETRTIPCIVDGKRKTERITSQLLINYSEKRARKDRHDRQRLVDKATRLAENPALLRSELKRGGKSYLNIGDNGLSATVDADKISKAEFWDGYYGIVYSDENMSPEEVMKIHHSLWQIEESFRISKSLLVARPCFHWKESRIRGHFLVCYLALVMYRLLELELHKHKIELTADEIFEALRKAAVNEVKLSSQEMVYCKMNTEGNFEKICSAVGIDEIKRISTSAELRAALRVKFL